MTGGDSRNIVITGVTRGLGRALALEFAALGHRVSGCGRSGSEIGPRGSCAAVDVTDEAAVRAWAREREAAEGPPDLLINNAGVINRHARLWEVPLDEFRRMWEVNVLGVFHVCRAFLPAMVARGTGVVVNVSTGAGVRGFPEIGPYCTTKHAVEGLTRSLAEELPEGMAAIPFQPGVVQTDLLHRHYGTRAAAYPEPDEWARVAAPFLLDLSARENGQSIRMPQVR
jgi:NAD(P)-dependent dehydrogenase (short-subunit alcohol dehydrogenase family)